MQTQTEYHTIASLQEWDISDNIADNIAVLLDSCFPDTFEGRTYFKQLPHARLLAFRQTRLIGHVGMDFRVIRVGEAIVPILGVIDLCVAEDERRHGLGAALLEAVVSRAASARAAFVILFADRADLYLKCGFTQVAPAEVEWLAIEDRTSHSLIVRDMTEVLLQKPVGGVAWPPGKIDMLGYLF